MRIRELQEIRFEKVTGNLKLSGLNPFKKYKSVNISIDDLEVFLDAVKLALADSEGQIVKLGK